MVPETGIRLHQGLIMGHPMGETPFSFGEFLDVSKQFPIRQHQYGEVQFVCLPKPGTVLQGTDGQSMGLVFYCEIYTIYLHRLIRNIGNNMKVSDIPLLDFFAKVDNLKVIHIIAVYQA